jgi:DNA polymerase-1
VKNEGIDIKNIYFDTMIASYVLDPSRGRHNMDYLAESFLNYKTVKYTDIVDVKKEMTLLDVDFDTVVNYAAEDADITLRLYNVFKPMLEKEGLESVFFDVDMQIVRAIGDMELFGVLIDDDYFKSLSSSFGDRAEHLALSIQKEAETTFNLNSPKQLAKVLFEDLGLTSKKKTKTGFSTDNQVLEEIIDQHEIIKEIIEYRKLVKLKSTYLDALPPLINEKTGRIHASFNQCVTATGRLSSTDPNMQNIPIRGDEGHLIRRGFVARKGCKILSADYSQIELRLLAHVTGDETLVNAYKNDDDIHIKTASLIYDVSTEDVTDEMRSSAKTINFAVIYGRGARNLSKDLKITTAEASEFRERYFANYSGVRDYIEAVKEKSQESGFVKTLFGRIRYLTGFESSNQRDIAQSERIAFNTIIQGTAADIIKLAMKNIASRLKEEGLKSKLIIQVHDELVFEVADFELEIIKSLVKEEMEGVTDLKVPLKVNINWGNNWDEAH